MMQMARDTGVPPCLRSPRGAQAAKVGSRAVGLQATVARLLVSLFHHLEGFEK